MGSCAVRTRDLREASAPEVGGLTLARLGGLLPAVVSTPADPARVLELRRLLETRAILATTTAQIEAMAANVRLELTYVSGGPVPLENAEDARFLCFREANGLLEHVAVVIGNRESWPDPVPVRLHSACLTGDLFGSLRCDCGQQLRGSLRVFAASGGGVLLYLAQEGRGIGLGNKLRAYLLQQEGLDTVDADGTLGFGADERRYDAGIEILRHLGIERVQLLTNNPEKVRALREGGIHVIDRQPLFGTLNRHNLRYVTAKVHRAGHWLGEMLAGALPVK
jgi:GTP cyclohydrolase II